MRIGVAHALTEFTLTEPVGEVHRRFPKIAFRLSTGWSRDLLERVRSGALDSAVILLPQGESLPAEVLGQQVAKERLVIVASRQHSSRRVRKIQDLVGAQWILNPEGCAARAGLRKVLMTADVDIAVAVEAYNYELQLALVAQNRGLSLVPERILARSRQRSRLRVLRVTGLEFPLLIWLVHRQPLAGFGGVITELSNALTTKLG